MLAPDDSWAYWARQAADAGQPGAAERAWAAAADEPLAAQGRARALLLLGRAAEAVELVGPDAPGAPVSWPGTLHLAARAALGHDDAWRRLLRIAAAEPAEPAGLSGPDGPTGPTALTAPDGPAWAAPPGAASPSAAGALTEVIGAVAEARGDVAIARRAAVELVAQHGVLTPRSVVALTAAELSRRDRDDAPGAIALELWRAVGRFSALRPGPDVDPAPVLQAAARLRDAGDPAGAHLLLRAASAQVREGLGFRPGAGAPRRPRVVVGAALVGLAAVVAGTASVAGRQAWLIIAAALAAGLVVDRWVPLPGLTRAETSAWRLLPSRRFDGIGLRAERGTVAAPAFGTFMGVLVGFVVATIALEGPFADAAWADAAPADALGWSLTTASAGAGWLAARRLHRRALREAARKAAAARSLAQAGGGDACRCWQDGAALVGEAARRYVEGHLVTVGPSAPVDEAFGGTARLAGCPASGRLWLAGPIGEHGTWLALHGRPLELDDDDTAPEVSSHGYL